MKDGEEMRPSFVDIPVSEARGNARFVREQADKYGRANIVDESGKVILTVHALCKDSVEGWLE